jgi:hypothetical protein
VPDDLWPVRDGDRMDHLFTLDLDEMPELRQATKTLADARAACFFIENADSNRAHTPYNGETALIAISAADLARAVIVQDGHELVATAIEVPTDVAWHDPEYEIVPELVEVHDAYASLPAHALGGPVFLQAPEWGGQFLLQFSDDFADVNLGDCGVMYVFHDTAFWQCH